MLSPNRSRLFRGHFIPGVPLIAVYWADLITRFQGDIYYRESRDFLEKSRVTSLIRKHKHDFYFIPTYLWIITWDDVHEYSINNKVSIGKGTIFTFKILNICNIIDWTWTFCTITCHFRSSHSAGFSLALKWKSIHSEVFIWEFSEIFWISSRDAFSTQSIIYDGAFLQK